MKYREKLGIYAPNTQDWSQRALNILEDDTFSWVVLREDQSKAKAEWLHHLGKRIILQATDHFNGDPHQAPGRIARELWALAQGFREYAAKIVLDNEPNYQPQGQDRWFAEQYARYYRALVAYWQWLDDGSRWELVSPAFVWSPFHNPLYWQQVLATTIYAPNMGAHSYWQTLSQRQSPDWALPWRKATRPYRNSDVFVLEMGCTNPMLTPVQRAQEEITFIRENVAEVVMLTRFILEGTSEWQFHFLTDDQLELYRQLANEEIPETEASDES